jgi:hypothetical protein
MKRFLMLATGLVFMGLTGCDLINTLFPTNQPNGNGNSNNNTNNDPLGDTTSAALRAFESENDLIDYINSQILARSEQTGKGEVKFFDREETVTTGDPNAAPQADDSATGGLGGEAAPPVDTDQSVAQDGGGNFSETTVQETGVDEADVMKTDGEFVYIISEQRLRIVRVTPPEDMALVSEIDLTGFGQEIYLRDNRIVALTQTYGYGGGLFLDDVFFGDVKTDVAIAEEEMSGGGSSASPGVAVNPIPVTTTQGAEPAGGDRPQAEPGDKSGATTDEPVRDLPADGNDPNVNQTEPNIDPIPVEPFPVEPVEFERPKTYVTIIDVTDAANPETISITIIDGNQNSSRMVDGVLHLVIANNAFDLTPLLPRFGREGFTVSNVNPMDLLPNYTRTDASGNITEGPLVTWETLYRPEAPDGFGTLSVASIDVDADGLPNGVGIVSDPSLVYASTEALYTTDTNYDFTGRTRQTTSIFKFDFQNVGVIPVAAGLVPGRILNQYSMGEYDGFLRVATTVRDFGERDFEPTNNLFVLEENEGSLDIVGRIEDIAPGETIQSARFTGERGFLVTFREIDPFFTLDLADPFNPQLIGELHIPGFSTYLVPMDDDHVLAVGQYIPDDRPFFGGDGVQVSIFDVTDFANPIREQNFVVESAYSEALYNPKAFTYFSSEGLVALPINVYDYKFEDFIDVPVDDGDFIFDDDTTLGNSGDDDGEGVDGDAGQSSGDATKGGGMTGGSSSSGPVSGGGVSGNPGTGGNTTTPDGDSGQSPPVDPAVGGSDDAPDPGQPMPDPDIDIDIVSPFPDEYERGGFDGLLVLSVDVNSGIQELGRINTRFDNRFYASFTRGLFIDDSVFAVTNGGVRGVPLSDFEADPFEVIFERPDYPFYLRGR